MMMKRLRCLETRGLRGPRRRIHEFPVKFLFFFFFPLWWKKGFVVRFTPLRGGRPPKKKKKKWTIFFSFFLSMMKRLRYQERRDPRGSTLPTTHRSRSRPRLSSREGGPRRGLGGCQAERRTAEAGRGRGGFYLRVGWGRFFFQRGSGMFFFVHLQYIRVYVFFFFLRCFFFTLTSKSSLQELISFSMR